MTLIPELGATVEKLNNVEQVMARLNIGRSQVFGLIRTGDLKSIKIGRRRLVSETALRTFIAGLEQD
jgi:excisionase family DNA binding protein